MSIIVKKYGQDIDLSREGKVACPRCRANGNDASGDNLMVYGLDENDHHRGAFCWSCEYTIPSHEHLLKSGGSLDDDEEEYEVVSYPFNEEIHMELKKATQLDGGDYRGIRTETSKFFGVRYLVSEDGYLEKVYYPVTKSMEMRVVGYKVRKLPKDFSEPLGEVGKDCDLFGQFRFKTHTGICLIVGGEQDQMAAFQMLADAQKDKKYDPVAVVSATVGESGAYKQIQSQYEWFNQFKKIIICMDADTAGDKAMQKIVDVLPAGKVYVMHMRRKDPNAYIWDNERAEPVYAAGDFIKDFWAHKQYVPEGVKSAAEAFDEIEEELLKPRITLPPYMWRMQEMMGGGMIQGRIANIIADTSTGKSTHVNRMVHHWIFNSPVTPTILTLEATAGQYLLEMVGVHVHKNLRWQMSDAELIEWLKTDEGQAIKNELCYKEDGTPRFYLIDNRSKTIKDLELQMEMLYRKHGSMLFIIDVLTDLLRGSSEEHSEDHMNWQRNMNKESVTVINVLHTRKPPTSPDGKTRKVTEYDALGTGSFVQSAAYNIVLNRDKLAEDILVKNTTEVDLPKCRGGKTGKAGDWFYDFMSMSCHDKEDYIRDHPELLVNF